MSNKKTYISNPEELSINRLFEVLEILALIESSGKYYKKQNVADSISSLEIENILSTLYENEADWKRRIKTAKKIYNSNAKYSKIDGTKKGSSFTFAKEKTLKDEPIYQALFIIGLSGLVLNNFLNLDFLNQFFQQKHPLSFLLFIQNAIRNKIILSFSYKSDRTKTISLISNIVPVQLTFRDGHWILIVLNIDKNYFVQYLIHCIESCEFYKLDEDDRPFIFKKPILFNIKEFYQNSFGISALRDREVFAIDIWVSTEDKQKIQKRRREGKWTKSTDYYIWTIKTQDPNEVFDYIFKWNGKIKILGPEKIKKLFQSKLKNFLS